MEEAPRHRDSRFHAFSARAFGLCRASGHKHASAKGRSLCTACRIGGRSSAERHAQGCSPCARGAEPVMAKQRVGKKSETSTGSEHNQPGTGRIEAFSDGVIAIIITIMVLNLKIPEGAAERGLWQGILVPLAPILI